MGKLAKKPQKTDKKVMENGAKWRFFEGPKRHFAVPGADGPGSQPASLPDLISVESGCIEPPPAPRNGGGAPFFTDNRTPVPVSVRATTREGVRRPRKKGD